MAPTTGTEMIQIQQRELARRAEVVRQRREAQEWRQVASPSFVQVMRLVDEANVAARLGHLDEADRMFAMAYGFSAPQVSQRP